MSSFIKNFKNQNYNEGFLPKSVLDTLESKWHGKLKYAYNKSGAYLLISTSDKTNIKFENFDIKDLDEIKTKCKKESISMDEILNYSYNAQKPIVLKPRSNFKQYINDLEVEMNEILISAKELADFQNGEIILTPSKMNNNINLDVGNGKESHNYKFIQKPIEHLSEKQFVSANNSDILLQYIIDDEKIKFNIVLNRKNMKNAKEYLKTLEFIKSLFDNGLYINGNKITEPGMKDKDYDKRNEVIDLWEKVVDIEKIVNFDFQIGKDTIDNEEIIDIYMLHKTLVQKKPIRKNQKINNFTYGFGDLKKEEIDKIKEEDKKNFCLMNSYEKEFTIFTKKIILFEMKCYFNLYIDDIEINEDKKKYIFLLEEKEKMYNSTMLFQTIEELISFQQLENCIEVMSKAEELFEDKVHTDQNMM